MDATLIKATTDSFEDDVLQSDLPVVVDFWAPWCSPCRLIAPVLEDLADVWHGKVRVAKVNVDEEPTLAGAYGVRGIPTIIGIHRGEVVHQEVGFRGKDPLETMFVELATLGEEQVTQTA